MVPGTAWCPMSQPVSKSHAWLGLVAFWWGASLTLCGFALTVLQAVVGVLAMVLREQPPGNTFETACLTVLVATATYYLGKERTWPTK